MKSFFSNIFLWILLVGAIALFLIGIYTWVVLDDLPSIEFLKDYRPPESSVVFDQNGQVVGRFFEERRTVISINKLPKYVLMAFLAAEDADFFNHKGIDYFGVIRAFFQELKHKTIGGRRVGGSTITQQTARTMFLSSRQTYARKLQEMVLTTKIEKALSKEQILHLYLNQIYFGNGAYGIEEASQTYFNKPANKLEIFEAAILASIPKSPNRINPLADTFRLKKRQEYVLSQMLRFGFITKEEEEKAKKMDLSKSVSKKNKGNEAYYFLESIKKDLLPLLGEDKINNLGIRVYSTLDLNYQKIAEKSFEKGILELDKKQGFRGPLLRLENDKNKLLEDFLEKYKKSFSEKEINKVWDLSYLNKENIIKEKSLQDAIKWQPMRSGIILGARVKKIDEAKNSAVVDLGNFQMNLPFANMLFAKKYIKEGKRLWTEKVSQILKNGDIILVKILINKNKPEIFLEQEPKVNGALIAMDVSTGGVLALVGGVDFTKSSFNRATQAKRQPGSGLKPLIYALAIEKGLSTPATIITDTPRAFFDNDTQEFWRPRNHTGQYLGDITLSHCLKSSINICTITQLEQIGLESFLQLAKNVGLITPATPYQRNLTLALGSSENYPIQVANAFRVLANQGRYSPSYMIKKVLLNNGQTKFIHRPSSKEVLKPQTTFIITNILKGVIPNNLRATSLAQVKSDLAGKTGTTNDARSTWFIGYSPQVLACVYLGHDDNRSLGTNEWGASTALPIWADFMGQLPIHKEAHKFIEPEGIEWRFIDQATGKAVLFSDNNNLDPEATITKEAFLAGTAPNINDENPIKNIKEKTKADGFLP